MRMFRAAYTNQVMCSCRNIYSITDDLFFYGAHFFQPARFNAFMTSTCSAIPAKGPDYCCLALTCPSCTSFQLLIDQIEVRRCAVVIRMRLITACLDCSICRCECSAPIPSKVFAVCEIPGCTRMLCVKCIGRAAASSSIAYRPPALCSEHMHFDPPLGKYTVGKHLLSNTGRHASRGNWSVEFKNSLPQIHTQDAVSTAAIDGIRVIIHEE